MTAAECLAIMVIDAMVLFVWLVGEGIYRRCLQWHTHHRVPHYKLRASRSRRATTVARPASSTQPGAGTKLLQAGDSLLDRDTAIPAGVESLPAPALPSTVGAGPIPPDRCQPGASPGQRNRSGHKRLVLQSREGSDPGPRQPTELGDEPGQLPLTAAVNSPTDGGQGQEPACTGNPRYPVQAGVDLKNPVDLGAAWRSTPHAAVGSVDGAAARSDQTTAAAPTSSAA